MGPTRARSIAARGSTTPRGAAVGFFATRSRKDDTAGPEAGKELQESVRRGLPAHFEAVGGALASGSGSIDACELAGHRLAQDGASLADALAALNRPVPAGAGAETGTGRAAGWGEG